MSGRTYVVILFFWAALTIITPTLILLSETSKPYLDSNAEKVEVIKARRLRMIGYAMKHPIRSTTEGPTPAPAPAPTPISEQKPDVETGESNLGKVFSESLRLVISKTNFEQKVQQI